MVGILVGHCRGAFRLLLRGEGFASSPFGPLRARLQLQQQASFPFLQLSASAGDWTQDGSSHLSFLQFFLPAKRTTKSKPRHLLLLIFILSFSKRIFLHAVKNALQD